MNTLIAIIVIFIISFSLFFLVVKRFERNKAVNRRLAVFIPDTANAEADATEIAKKNIIKDFIASSGKLLNGITFSKSTEKLLAESGSMLRPEEYFVLRILISIGAVVFSLLTGLNILIGIGLCVVGFMYPHFYLKTKRKKRLYALSFQLIETLGIMANSLRAGFSFMQAMQLAGKETPDPLGPELERVVREVGLGVPIEEVFESMLMRLPNKELEVVIRAILAQRRSGGNLAELLETMEETIRGRIRVLEELRTLTSQGRISSWVITLVPVGLGLYLNFASGDYFSPMLEHPLGWLMLSLAAVSVVIGWLVIRKINNIEV